jgi:two-component system cell cycle sensor histidine kinase/response regulator CckA
VLHVAGLVDIAEDILEALPAGLMRISAEGRVLSLNRAAREFLGLGAEAGIGQRTGELWWAWVGEEGAVLSPDEQPVSRCLTSGQAQGPSTLGVRRRDGKLRWGSFDVFPARDPQGAAGAVVAFVDVTERLESERERREAESRNHALLEGAFEGIVISVDGKIVECNRAFADMFGYDLDEAIGCDAYALASPASRAMVMHNARAGLTEAYVAEGLRKDGSRLMVELLGRNAVYKGQRARVTGLRDVTERERAAAELRGREEQRRRLEEQARQAQKLESLGVLAGGVAHDFNNLLVGVMGYTELALREVPPASPARECLQMVLASAARAAELVQQMLAYAGRAQLAFGRVVLNDVVKATIAQVNLGKRVRLSLDLAPELPAVKADANQIGRVATSLITNASEAIGDESGEIVVATRRARVDAAMIAASAFAAEGLCPGEYVCLEVRDTGGGMDDETKRKLFEPFFSTKFTGRGLGLAAVFGVVRAHKGLIVVDSSPGQGSRFAVYLTAAPTA